MLQLILISLVGAFTTLEFSRIFKGHQVRISALSTLTFHLFNQYYVPSIDQSNYLTLFFAATFIGMSTHTRIGRLETFVASIVLANIYLYGLATIGQLGGALGFLAFTSIIIALGLRYLIGQIVRKLSGQPLSYE